MADDHAVYRRARRRRADSQVALINEMTGDTIGELGNLSVTGLLALTNRVLVEDALYQLRLRLDGTDGSPIDLTVGCHHLWTEEASAYNQFWAGFRFIDVAQADLPQLQAWVDRPGGQYE